MKIREMYEYLYYKIYKAMNNEAFPWGADWRACGVLLIVDLLFVYSFVLYYMIFDMSFNIYITAIIPCVFFAVLHIYLFLYQDRWRSIVEKYDHWPEKKNVQGSLIVWGVIIFVFVHFIFALHISEKFGSIS